MIPFTVRELGIIRTRDIALLMRIRHFISNQKQQISW